MKFMDLRWFVVAVGNLTHLLYRMSLSISKGFGGKNLMLGSVMKEKIAHFRFLVPLKD
jgi:hypothetical protein